MIYSKKRASIAGNKFFVLCLTLFLTAIIHVDLKAQKISLQSNLYEQASEVSGLVIQYGQDINAIKDFYWPYHLNPNEEYQQKYPVLNSPEQRKRLTEVNNDYLKKLDMVDFDTMSVYGKVDYILLKKKIKFDL